MKFFIKIGLVILCLTSVKTVIAQNKILKEFKELNKHYQELNDFRLDFEIQYLDWNETPLTKSAGTVIHTDKLHYVNLNGNITLVRSNQYVSVNSGFQTIIYSEFETKNKTDNIGDISSLIDSLWTNQINISYKLLPSVKGQMRVFVEEKASEYFDAYEIIVDIKKNRLLEFKYYLKSDNSTSEEPVSQIHIKYVNESTRIKNNLDILKISHYIKKQKGKLTPTDLYKKFEIIDQSEIIGDYE